MYSEPGPSRNGPGAGSRYGGDPGSGSYNGKEFGREDRPIGLSRGMDPSSRAGPSSSPYTRAPPRAFPPRSFGGKYPQPGSPPREDRFRDRDRLSDSGRRDSRGREWNRDVRDSLGLDSTYREPGDTYGGARIGRDFDDSPGSFSRNDGYGAPLSRERWEGDGDDRGRSRAFEDPRGSADNSRRSSPTKNPYGRERHGTTSPPKPPRPDFGFNRPNYPRSVTSGPSYSHTVPSNRDRSPESAERRRSASEQNDPAGQAEVLDMPPGPSSARSSPGVVTPPRAPRSLRGSSSPVESRHVRTAQTESAPPSRVQQVVVKQEPVVSTPPPPEEELEEGEVLSPVRSGKDLRQRLEPAPNAQSRFARHDWSSRPGWNQNGPPLNDRFRDHREGYQSRGPPPGDPRRARNGSPTKWGRSPHPNLAPPPPKWQARPNADNGWPIREKWRRGSAGPALGEEGTRSGRPEMGRRRVSDQGRIAEGEQDGAGDTSYASGGGSVDPDASFGSEVGTIAEEPARLDLDSEMDGQMDIQPGRDEEDRPPTPPLPPLPGMLQREVVKEEPAAAPVVSPGTRLQELAKEEEDRPDTPALPEPGAQVLQKAQAAALAQNLSQAAELSTIADAAPLTDGNAPLSPHDARPSLDPSHNIQREAQTVLHALNEIVPIGGRSVTAETAVAPISPARESRSLQDRIDTPHAPAIASEPSSADTLLAPAAVLSSTMISDPPDFPASAHISPSDNAKTSEPPALPLRLPTSPNLALAKSPPTPKQTLAERRSVQLPPTQGPLSSPFGERFPRRDPAPTVDSVQESTDTEVWPRTVDLDDNASEISVDAAEENLMSVIKQAQATKTGLDVESILAWNIAAAPEESTRVPELVDDASDGDREIILLDICQYMDRQQRDNAQKVALTISNEESMAETRTQTLEEEYRQLDEEWQEHCRHLDELMVKRGPPPESLYALPNAIPAVTPGPIPTTPVAEDISARAMRRRGAGDAVTTEAEFQEILAAMADTAAKDPNYRASKTTAAVPDMLPPEERRLRYQDENDLVDDPIAFYDFKGIAEPIWTEEERQIFVRRYLNFPKQFGKISEALPDKSASDCVLYYYRTKKEVDYKSMLASRRGVTRKKALPIKKGGKSAALLANLDQKKPTVSSPPVRTIATPARHRDSGAGGGETQAPQASGARRGRGRVESGSVARRRMAEAQQGDDGREASEPPSREDSEAPLSIAKGKSRSSVKGPKRPRRSSLAPTMGAEMHPGLFATEGDPESSAAQAELLPPVKRARKSRKTATILNGIAEGVTFSETAESVEGEPIAGPSHTPAGSLLASQYQAHPQGLPPVEKPARRGTTSSYWSIDEKRRVKSLVDVYRLDFEAIARSLTNKTWKQVKNFVIAHADELGVELESELVTSRPLTGQPQYFRPSVEAGFTRSIYDVYNTGSIQAPPHPRDHAPVEPRLGVFPSASRSSHAQAHVTPATAVDLPSVRESPIKPISRPGGMRISALLNDDPAEEAPARRDVPTDAQSDGTVEEDTIRPSPRGMPPIPASTARRLSADYRHERPDLDRYREAGQRGPYLYHPNPVTASAWTRRDTDSYYSTPVSRAHTAAPPAHTSTTHSGHSLLSQSRHPHSSHVHHPTAPVHVRSSIWSSPAPSSHPHPPPHSHSHPQPHMGYFSSSASSAIPSSRPETYRAQTTSVLDYRSHQLPAQHPHPPPPSQHTYHQQQLQRDAHAPPAHYVARDRERDRERDRDQALGGRYDRPDWRGHSPVPGQASVSSPAMSAPTPLLAGQGQGDHGRYSSPGPAPGYATLPPMKMFEDTGEPRR